MITEISDLNDPVDRLKKVEPVGKTYTMGIVWDDFTPSVMARIMRDCFQIARLCKVNRMGFQIACASSDLDQYLPFLEAGRTKDLEQASYWRVYATKEAVSAPEHATLTDVINVEPGKGSPQLLVNDPNFPEKVEYIDVQKINDTVPLWRSPPVGPADGFQSDF